ncbi:MAG: outer membrane protein assembly factor BamD [Candidatus Pelagibacter sp.]|nr:outer membrane protein assembly factor BamD [Candidatus Pelagibacter sp.]OUW24234.1 MAG: hypothetical protein CBD34_01245 [Rickettsiales bacterium TMED174]
MTRSLIIFSILFFIFTSCTKKETVNVINPEPDEVGMKFYQEGISALEEGDFFYASKIFSDAETNFLNIEMAAKSAILSSYSFYRINFYVESHENLKRFIRTYPASKYIPYAHYLITIISFEQILDEKKDLKPTRDSKKLIIEYLNKFPDTEYSIDLKFKLDLVNNQLAAKEMYVARYYMKTQKWIPAINRLKKVVDEYQETVFIEEALHRLVEVYYRLGLVKESEEAAKYLGYNYNSSEWYKKSYVILNKNYKLKDFDKSKKKKDDGLIKKVIKNILGKND